jgi:UDP-N-acetyl-D-mannosaminuronic acid transferase (WecB/TagA/CpsF family)
MGVSHSNKVSDWLIHEVDNHDIVSFAPLAASFGHDRFGYVVTPNADDLVRCRENAEFREHCRGADYVLLNSRFAAFMLRLVKGVKLRVCSGSELTSKLLSQAVTASDRVVLIGGSREEAQTMQALCGLTGLVHHEPPPGFADDPDALEECSRLIESHSPFRFCFLAVGSPQQEALAAHLKARDVARGLALCLGASLAPGLDRLAQQTQQLALQPRAAVATQAAARNAHAATGN